MQDVDTDSESDSDSDPDSDPDELPAAVEPEKDDLIADDHAELVVWVIHQRVMEAFFENGETFFPSRILVDDLLN